MQATAPCPRTRFVTATIVSLFPSFFTNRPRDITVWVRGLLRYNTGEGGDSLVEVAAHEAMRIFRDRLVDSDHQQRFDALLNGTMRSKWSVNVNIEGVHFT